MYKPGKQGRHQNKSQVIETLYRQEFQYVIITVMRQDGDLCPITMAIGNKSVTSVKVRVIADVGGCERETSECKRPRSSIYNTSLQLVNGWLHMYLHTYILGFPLIYVGCPCQYWFLGCRCRDENVVFKGQTRAIQNYIASPYSNSLIQRRDSHVRLLHRRRGNIQRTSHGCSVDCRRRGECRNHRIA